MTKRQSRPGDKTIRGGCPCGFWSAWNCSYVQAVHVCRAPRDVRPQRLAAHTEQAPEEAR